MSETVRLSAATSYRLWHSGVFRSFRFPTYWQGILKSCNYCSFPVFIAALGNHAVLLVVLSSGHCTVDNSLKTRCTHYTKGQTPSPGQSGFFSSFLIFFPLSRFLSYTCMQNLKIKNRIRPLFSSQNGFHSFDPEQALSHLSAWSVFLAGKQGREILTNLVWVKIFDLFI